MPRWPAAGQGYGAVREPLHFKGRFDGVPPGRARRQVTDEVMAAIQALTGQPEAGVYNERPATID